jgi:hypothetical protein
MVKVYAPNNQYTGISASVPFINGVGECSDPALLKWFRDHGYEVEETDDELTELRTRGKELGIRGAHNMGEEKLRGAIKETEQLLELREKAVVLGIEDADKKDAETLTAEIAAKDGGGDGQ